MSTAAQTARGTRLATGAIAMFAGLLHAQSTQPQVIQSIAICSPTGPASVGSCPSGSFDTQQLVVGSNGSSINSTSGFGVLPDEHSSVFAPGMLGSNQDYLFFLAGGTAGHADIGVTVLSGGAGPSKTGQWTLNIPTTDGYGAYSTGFGQVFETAMSGAVCPTVADGNPAHQDQTFDLHYAASGSVMIDPTGPPGSLVMIYEGTNACLGVASGPVPNTSETTLPWGSQHRWTTARVGRPIVARLRTVSRSFRAPILPTVRTCRWARPAAACARETTAR